MIALVNKLSFTPGMKEINFIFQIYTSWLSTENENVSLRSHINWHDTVYAFFQNDESFA